MSTTVIPLATYRLQFNRDFTFAQAAEIIPYLAALGISHCYASPYLRARPGSMHGYDIIDHNQLNPEIGTPEDFERFVDALHGHGMGQILDIVPNHMGVMGADNVWWLDLLENGEASNYSSFFDIDWHPLKDELQGKVLIPVLDDQYGTVLDRGDLQLSFDAEKGEFSIFYHQHRFPIDPREYPVILGRQSERLAQSLGADNHELLELQSLTAAFRHLPDRGETSTEKKAERNRDKEIHKRRLASLCAQSQQLLEFVLQNVGAFNGVPGDSRSFDELHELIKTQVFRLAYWRVAADDINYRRFFDINDLAGLSMENRDVFEATHRFVLELVRSGKVNGLRIDHPDGLFNPAQYFERIQAAQPVYVVAEKILSGDESLPREWPIHGTTGYDFSNLVNGLFVDVTVADKMRRSYRGFVGQALNFRQVLYDCKQNVMNNALASELNVLASILSRVALSNRHTCDFTLNSLHTALTEVVANFPVYRTYLTESSVSDRDRWYIETAIQAAKKQSRSEDMSVFDFIRQVLLTRENGQSHGIYRKAFVTFAMKLQQFTSPVMAKGLEDTSFYRYHPLMSLNDVGGNPLEFGVTAEEFHANTLSRAESWPHAMLCSSTHDSKLSEDVRARINVLSELPGQWRLRARQWRAQNRSKKLLHDGVETPSRNDEYLLYQIMLGVWPPGQELPDDKLRERLANYMLKAAREAKQFTSWANQNSEYEKTLSSFLLAVLDAKTNQEFLADFLEFQRRVAQIGIINSLSQTLIKLTAPGVPDIYQGSELFEFRLVDPDNRQPVDYASRQELLAEIRSYPSSEYADVARGLVESIHRGDDRRGRSKLFLTWRALQARQTYPQLFREGNYVPLTVEGPAASHFLAFARTYADSHAIIAVPRLVAKLMEDRPSLLDPEIWRETRIIIPASIKPLPYCNWMTAEPIAVSTTSNGEAFLDLTSTGKNFPWILLFGSTQ
jgi:(1->4)-alpha-D-glucan 1-alpha-D-glucosylmutase